MLNSPVLHIEVPLLTSISVPWCHGDFSNAILPRICFPTLLHLVASDLSFLSQLNCHLLKEILLYFPNYAMLHKNFLLAVPRLTFVATPI